MFRSLHMKLVLILVLLIISVMAVVGIFLMSNVSTFYLDKFYDQVGVVFGGQQSDESLITSLQNTAQEDGYEGMMRVLEVQSSKLGINDYRNYYILDQDGRYLVGSNESSGRELTRTHNIIAAMAGEIGDSATAMDTVMDVAIPIRTTETLYIVYVVDDKQEVSELSGKFLVIIMQAMMFGLLAAVLLSFLLSKTITTPIERLTEGARKIAQGQFGQKLEVQSSDEVGALTQSFNEMAKQLRSTIGEVKSERDKLSTLFLHMTDGMVAFSTDGTVIHINPATEMMLGVRANDTLTFDDIFADVEMPQQEETAMRSFMTTEITRGKRVLSVTLAPYGTLEGDGGVMAVIHDITEQRKLDEARREFVANVSHELRTPLTNIHSYTETLYEAVGDLPEETEKRFLGVIMNESERMARIVTDLLTLSKLDYGRMELKVAPFSPVKMLETVVDAMRMTAQEKEIVLSSDIQAGMPKILGDEERLQQVVVNVLSNAVKYTANGGHVSLKAYCNAQNQLEISVQDDGYGIPEDDVPRIFERFYRVDKARSREAGGTGLGLAIAREIVEQHGGTIRLTSDYGKGTRVVISLPLDGVSFEEAQV